MRYVNVRLLKDGTNRVRIHWLYYDPDGPVVAPAAVLMSSLGPLAVPPRRWRLACQPQLTDLNPKVQGMTVHPVIHSDDTRAVTCPECMATKEFQAVQAELSELADV